MSQTTQPQIDVKSPVQVKSMLENDGNVVLIDVREPSEYREVHAKGAKNLPLSGFRPQEVPAGKVAILCKSGGRARKAAEQLKACGRDCFVVDGGTDAWVAAGLDSVVASGSTWRPMSLERQVRIAAGGLVVIGVVLSLLVHPWFIGISAFVGCGLMFAGITDWCGMAMMLAKMPWNR